MNSFISFNANLAKEKPNTHHNADQGCPFCVREGYEENLIEDRGDMFWVKNKFNTFNGCEQTVLIETCDCDANLATFSKKHLHKLMRFAFEKWFEMENSGEYKSVTLIKNHGVFSASSLKHAHMQLVGYPDLDYRDHLNSVDFTGVIVKKNEHFEWNVSTQPKSEFYEFNLILLDSKRLDERIDEFANELQTMIRFLLEKMNPRYQSFNLAFYQFEGKIICKVINRIPTSVFFLAYRLSQVPNNLEEIAKNILEFERS